MGAWVRAIGVAAALALVAGAGPAAAACHPELIAKLPITIEGQEAVTPGKIGGQDVRFVIDSGAFYSTMSEAEARLLKVPLEPARVSMTGVGGNQQISAGEARNIEFGGQKVSYLEFAVGGTDVRSILFGRNLLGLGDDDFDFANGVTRIINFAGCRNEVLAYWVKDRPYSMVKMVGMDDDMGFKPPAVIPVTINGVPLKALLDTGAESSMLSLKAAAKLGLKPGVDGVIAIGESTGVGRQRVASYRGRFTNFVIDSETIKSGWIDFGELGDMDADMLLGMDFFIAHHVLISNSQGRVYFTYNGGGAFLKDYSQQNTKSGPYADALAEPKDAAGYRARGMALFARGYDERALGDLNKAIAMDGSDPETYLDRARIEGKRGDTKAAAASIEAAIRTGKGDLVNARLMRAGLLMDGDAPDRAGALADLHAVAAALPADDVRQDELAVLLLDARDYRGSVEANSKWLSRRREDAHWDVMLNNRCWARALGNFELAEGLADCQRALRVTRGAPGFLDSQALVRLRMGDLDGAMRDYDAVLKAHPKVASSLYGRSVVEARKGDAAAAKRDREAAIAAGPRTVAMLEAAGVK